ncbi:hypothetical protein [Microbacterium sp. NPDC096154]|uniref:hypothetical protein n=1 Tax=Microbacterium sp. NPDC096154 TaxID=3155549 RepID=UPI00332FE348
MASRLDRLEFADDMFLRLHRGAGSPAVNQFVWRLPGAYDPRSLHAFGEALSRGALHRRVARTPVPLARDRWAPAAVPAVVRVQREAVPVDGVIDWMEAQAALDVDPHRGTAWALSAAPADDGSIVSLTATHAAADGAALLEAIRRAAAGDAPAPPAPLPPIGALMADDVRDAAAQVRAIAQWARSRRGAAPEPARAALTPLTDEPPLPAEWRVPIAVAEIATADAEAVAAARGGTLNSWFVALTARISAASGRVAPGDHVPVALPVSTRRDRDDRRANTTDIARADIDPETLAARDLGRVRALCKQAYVELAAAPPPPVPLAALQMLPDAVVKRLPQPPTATLLASNVGLFPDVARSAFGPEATAITGLAHQIGANAEAIDAAGAGIYAWTTQSGPRLTVTLAACDPRRITDRTALHRLLQDELAAWDLTARLW